MNPRTCQFCEREFDGYRSIAVLCPICRIKRKIAKAKSRPFTGRDLVRERVRLRDGHTCQICRRVWKEGERRFDIHHIYECGLKSRKYDRKTEMDGLITYCHRCHLTMPHNLEKMRVGRERARLAAAVLKNTPMLSVDENDTKTSHIAS